MLARIVNGPRGSRLLGDQLFLAEDGKDYTPGIYGHRALSPEFVRDAALRARRDGLAYLAFHNHGGSASVAFSPVDIASHERGYPAIRKITGQVVGAVVCTPTAAAGDLWLPDGTREPLAELVLPGSALRRLRPDPAAVTDSAELFDRQARLFGDAGQACFAGMRVAIVGQGGAGSLLTEFLARLGVGSLLLIDADDVETSNLPRLLGARRRDVGRPKVALGRRNARRANRVDVKALRARVEDPESLHALSHCDWIFLAADSHAARHWVNAIVEAYLIPATEVGVTIPVDDAGDIGRIHTVYRRMIPGQGCFWCNSLIDATKLAVEMLPANERKSARYIEEVPAPSVITLNALVAGQAATDFMLSVTDLHQDQVADQHLEFVRTGQTARMVSRRDPSCHWCGDAGLPNDLSLASRIGSARPLSRRERWMPHLVLRTLQRGRTKKTRRVS